MDAPTARRTKAHDPHYGAEMLHVEWAESEKAPVVEVTSKISTQDRAIDLTQARPIRRSR